MEANRAHLTRWGCAMRYPDEWQGRVRVRRLCPGKTILGAPWTHQVSVMGEVVGYVESDYRKGARSYGGWKTNRVWRACFKSPLALDWSVVGGLWSKTVAMRYVVNHYV